MRVLHRLAMNQIVIGISSPWAARVTAMLHHFQFQPAIQARCRTAPADPRFSPTSPWSARPCSDTRLVYRCGGGRGRELDLPHTYIGLNLEAAGQKPAALTPPASGRSHAHGAVLATGSSRRRRAYMANIGAGCRAVHDRAPASSHRARHARARHPLWVSWRLMFGVSWRLTPTAGGGVKHTDRRGADAAFAMSSWCWWFSAATAASAAWDCPTFAVSADGCLSRCRPNFAMLNSKGQGA